MNAYQLARADTGEHIDKWGCGACHSWHHDKAAAVGCCVCSHCGDPCQKFFRLHDECRMAELDDLKAARLVEAEIVEGYTGPVCFDGDKYFEDIGRAGEYFETEDGEPEFVNCCTIKNVITDNLLWDALSAALEDEPEECVEAVVYPDSLQAAWSEMVKRNASVKSWRMDTSRKVRLRTGAGSQRVK